MAVQLIMATLPSLPLCNDGKGKRGARGSTPIPGFCTAKASSPSLQTTIHSGLKSRGTQLSMRASVLLRP
jgi:hypothetical protein